MACAAAPVVCYEHMPLDLLAFEFGRRQCFLTWSEKAKRLQGKHLRISKLYELPMGTYLLSLEAKRGSAARGCGSFQHSGGDCVLIVKCVGSRQQSQIFTVKAGLSDGQWTTARVHDFSAESVLRLPGTLRLGSVAGEDGHFSVKVLFQWSTICRPKQNPDARTDLVIYSCISLDGRDHEARAEDGGEAWISC